MTLMLFILLNYLLDNKGTFGWTENRAILRIAVLFSGAESSKWEIKVKNSAEIALIRYSNEMLG